MERGTREEEQEGEEELLLNPIGSHSSSHLIAIPLEIDFLDAARRAVSVAQIIGLGAAQSAEVIERRGGAMSKGGMASNRSAVGIAPAAETAVRVAGKSAVVAVGIDAGDAVGRRRARGRRRRRRRVRLEQGNVGRVVVHHFAQRRLGRGAAADAAAERTAVADAAARHHIGGRQRHRLVDGRHQDRLGVRRLLLRQQFRVIR